MYIDIGAKSDKEIEKAGIRIGDPIIPISEFTELSIPNTYMSKAFDDRIGCTVLVSVLERLKNSKTPNSVYGATTVQEEVGVRGATTSVEMIDPRCSNYTWNRTLQEMCPVSGRMSPLQRWEKGLLSLCMMQE